jgi:hypothetical protein
VWTQLIAVPTVFWVFVSFSYSSRNCRLFFNYYYLMSRHSSWPLPLNFSMYLHNSPVTETELHISYISIFTTLPLFYPKKKLNAKNVLVIFFLLPGRYDNVFVKKEKNMFPLTLLAPILNIIKK